MSEDISTDPKLPVETPEAIDHFDAMSATDLSPIERLSRELICAIVEYVPESIFDLRLVSQTCSIT